MRIICLIFCCDTKDLGSQSHLNNLNVEEIHLYQQKLALEIKKREEEKKANLSRDETNMKSGNVVPKLDLKSEAGSSKTKTSAELK